MAGCLAAQHAQRRVDRLAERVDELDRLVALLAAVAGVDLGRLDLLDRLVRRGEFPATWDEMVALRLDPDTGSVA